MKLRITIGIPNWLDRIFAWPVLSYRKRRFGYPYRKIRLTEGKFALVDQQDFYWLNSFDWFAKKNRRTYYAVRLDNDSPKWATMVCMHRQIMDFPEGLLVDHRNLEGLDNRRDNLRTATRLENNYNKPKRKNALSRFKGVSFHKHTRRWHAQISVNGKRISLRYFKNEIDAAKAYDEAARKYHKDFARLNFPEKN